MDRRSWPWKKKSSDKAEKAAAASEAAAAAALPQKEDSYKKPKYVQISVEQYSHLTGLEEQVETYEEQVKSYEAQAKTYEEQVQTYEEQIQTYEEQVQTLSDEIEGLNEKLSAALAEITTKENLVKQHSKVAEDAVSGWEKAEAEALALKSHLESVTLSKLTAEDRAAHLDGALKECMRQIRNLKEDHEQKLQEVFQTKTKQMEKITLEFEKRIADYEQELLRSAADNDALSRTLQERSNMIVKMSEEKSRAEAEIELLKTNIESCQREINSLKYEVHVVSKELEIRNEEKNMSVRSAEVANKQYMEGVKKIAKLEAECQRLRGLVKKKLPGPAALAQMKLEVENLGKDYGDSRLKRSPVKTSSPHMSPVARTSPASEFSLDNVQKFQKENEFLTERLLAMEEETKMLKEALAKRNSELLDSRDLCAQTTSKLQSLEAKLQQKSPQKSGAEVYSSPNGSKPPSLTSMSEDGNDDAGSYSESSSTAPLQTKKDKNTVGLDKAENNHLELMDDFLEMEKLACLSNDTKANGSADVSGCSNNKKSGLVNPDMGVSVLEKQSHPDQAIAMHLCSRISKVLVSASTDADVEKVLGTIKRIVEDVNEILIKDKPSDITCNGHAETENAGGNAEKEIFSSQDTQLEIVSQELAAAISQIHEFVLLLGKKERRVRDASSEGERFLDKTTEFSAMFNRVMSSEKKLDEFVVDLSRVLTEASKLKINMSGYESSEVEIPSPDCIDKVALPESKVIPRDSSEESYQNGCSQVSHPEVPDDGNMVSGCESNTRLCNFTPEEYDELKSEKETLATDLEAVKSRLQETEQVLADVKSQLASAQKTNSLAETQLKCMTQSYRLLETRAAELETEMTHLQEKIENLENELEDEKRSHQDAIAKCKELEEQLQRIEGSSVVEDVDDKTRQEKELAAAAEKLAECQETIFFLGRQLNGLRPQAEQKRSLHGEKGPKIEGFSEDEPTTTSGKNTPDFNQAETDTGSFINLIQKGAESPKISDSPGSPSDNETNMSMRSPTRSNNVQHRHARSSSSSSSSTPTPEKPSRGFSRFFSSK